jgi:hypothetical protein
MIYGGSAKLGLCLYYLLQPPPGFEADLNIHQKRVYAYLKLLPEGITTQPTEQGGGSEMRLNALGPFGRAASRALWDLKTSAKLPRMPPPN